MNIQSDPVDRSPGPSGVRTYVFGQFRVDLATNQLVRDGDVIPLAAKVFDTLVVLIKCRNRVVDKTELMSLVWPKLFVSEDSLTHSISVLRRALNDHSTQPEFIATIPRRGYRFISPVTELAQDDTPVAPSQIGSETGQQNDHMLTLDGEVSGPTPKETRTAPPWRVWLTEPTRLRRTLRWLTLASAALALVATLALARGLLTDRQSLPKAESLHFSFYPPTGTRLVSGGVLSPDGRHLAFVAMDQRTSKTQLWVRDLNSPRQYALAGTEDAVRPFWSPDGRSLGFFANYLLKRVNLDGGLPNTLLAIGLNPGGGSWGRDDQIIFSVARSGLYSIRASGGTATAVTTPDRTGLESQHGSPQFLPDGRRFLYVVSSTDPGRAGTFAGSLDTGEKVRVLDLPAVYVPPGFLILVRDGALIARRFDAVRLRLIGDPVLVAGDVSPSTVVSASTNGLLAFGGSTADWRTIWFTRTGQQLETIDAPSELYNLRLSPDGRLLIAESGLALPQRAIWLIDLHRGGATRLGAGNGALTSPDGLKVAFTSYQGTGVGDMYIRSRESNEEQLLLSSREPKSLTDWTNDGRYVVYVSRNPRTKADLWLLPRFGDGIPAPYSETLFNEIQGRVSPDGRWIAYASDESGAWEVYVQSFPVPGSKQMISVAGGAQPQWRTDGRELFYIAADRQLMAVSMNLGATVEASRPTALFRAPVPGTIVDVISHYAVAADGQRFVINTTDESDQKQISVVVDWTAAVER